jgi:hypothetical protein
MIRKYECFTFILVQEKISVSLLVARALILNVCWVFVIDGAVTGVCRDVFFAILNPSLPLHMQICCCKVPQTADIRVQSVGFGFFVVIYVVKLLDTSRNLNEIWRWLSSGMLHSVLW